MFQKNKFSHMVTVQCSDGEHEATYTFIEGPDDDYGEIAKEKFYNKRFDDFIEFYNNFYSGKRIYPTDLKDQSSLFDYPELNLSVACFNSCYHLDHLRFSGYINPHSLSSITRDLLMKIWIRIPM